MNDEKTTRYIRAIERTRSISAAATELGISQPALSAFLKKTEDKLGTAIFDRSASPLALTEAGAALLDYQDKSSQLRRELERKVSDIEHLRCGKLVIAGATSFNATFLPNAIAEFARRYPAVELHIIDDTVPNIMQAALEGKIDVFIAPEPPDSDDFDCVPLFEERVFLCLPPSWPENDSLPVCAEHGERVGRNKRGEHGERPGWDERPSHASRDEHPGRVKRISRIGREDFALLENRPFITLGEQQQLGRIMRHLFDAYDVHPPRIIHAEQTVTSLALTLNGIGASLITEGLAPSGTPSLYLPDDPSCIRTLFVMAPTNRAPSRAAEEFVKIVRHHT